MDGLSNIANRTILPPDLGKILIYPDGQTSDIISEIIETDAISQNDTAKFAPSLKGRSLEETLSNIWHFLKSNIKYKLDPLGFQFVKTPSRTWKDKFADCKSFSIFVASILKNLNIPFSYRFVSFVKGGDYTHVYVVVPVSGKLIIMDVVMPAYNKEKPFQHKKDIPMTQIYRLSGIGEEPLKTKIIDLGNKDISGITDGEMDLLLARDRLKTEKEIVESKRGIGSLIGEKYQDSIDMINDSLEAVNGYRIGAVKDIEQELDLIAEAAVNGEYSIAHEVAGIGSIGAKVKKRVQKKAERKQKIAVAKKNLAVAKQTAKTNPAAKPAPAGKSKKKKKAGKTKTGKFLKKVAKSVKKGVKAVTKVATLPMRLTAKAILEVALPKAAPFFLYLFITDPKVLDKCPAKVKAKRKKAQKVSDFIVNGIGMKRTHFMSIVRNGILKHYKKQPEVVLADMMKGIAGIGVISAAVVTSVVGIIQKIAKLIKKKGEKVSASDSPDGSDFGEMSTDLKSVVARELKLQPENTSALNTDSENPDQPLAPEILQKQAEKESEETEPGEVTTTGAGSETGSGPESKAKKKGKKKSGKQSTETTANNFESGGKSIWNSMSS